MPGWIIEPVGRDHELVYEATEGFWRVRWAIVRFGQYLLEHIGDPAVAGRAIMLVLGIQLLEELGDVHARAVNEVLGFILVLSVVTTDVSHDEIPKGFQVATTKLHPGIVASRA